MSQWLIVARKEIFDNLRDRRTLLSSFSVAIFGPLFFVGVMSFVLNRALGDNDDEVQFAVQGAEFAPQLVEYLQGENSDITLLGTEDAEALVTSDTHKVVMVIQPDFAERYARGDPNAVTLIYDSSALGSGTRTFRQVRELIQSYSLTIGALRLQMRGIDPAVARPIAVQGQDLASPAERALSILATLPYLMVLVVFMGAMYLAIDTTAGEREHGSLEPLLTQPVTRASLVFGKLIATAVFSAMSLALFILTFTATLPMIPFERIGLALSVGWLPALGLFLVTLPLVCFAAAMLTVVASFARSYKEAQTYLGIVVLIPTLPLIITRLLNVESSLWLMAVPSLAQSNLISDLIVGEPLQAGHIVLSIVSTLLAAAGLTWIAIRLYSRDRILM